VTDTDTEIREPAFRDLGIGQATELLIGGKWIEAERGRTFTVRSPANGSVVGQCAAAGRADTVHAIEAAEEALSGWSALEPSERGQILAGAADRLEERTEPLARLITLEGGKPIAEARGEVAYAAGFLQFYAQEAEAALSPRFHLHAEGKRVRTVPRPAGVCGVITIWNFPAAGITRPLGAALAAGCTAVLKPAEQTPLSAVAVSEVLCAAGLPSGVANLLTAADPAPVGSELATSETVRKLSFTGSAEVGTALLGRAAPQAKRVTLELGGHAPLIVLADADLDAAVEGAIRAKFRNSGQTCTCVNRIYVEQPVYRRFRERFGERVAALRAGDPMQEDTEVGPLIDAEALARVERHVEDALDRGASLLCGGRRVEAPGVEAGLLYAPTALADVPPEALVMREETFGPVAPLAAVASPEEAIASANALPWGLAAYVYSEDRERAEALAASLDYGVIGINDPLPAAPHLPFGGLKRSGLGKEGGRAGIEEFLETQLISSVES
jgi:succinate-semialdehyde dehydrogenase / glutarate-semialdehyde dehydrogenase